MKPWDYSQGYCCSERSQYYIEKDSYENNIDRGIQIKRQKYLNSEIMQII